MHSYHKADKKQSSKTYAFLLFLTALVAIAALVVGIIAICKKDNDTKYVIPDTSAITPYSNFSFSTQMEGTSNSLNATVMIEQKGNVITLGFYLYYANCSSNPNTISTDPIPEQYRPVNASNPDDFQSGPSIWVRTFTLTNGDRGGAANIDTGGRVNIWYQYPLNLTWSSDLCQVYPFTIVYFKNTTYTNTNPPD